MNRIKQIIYDLRMLGASELNKDIYLKAKKNGVTIDGNNIIINGAGIHLSLTKVFETVYESFCYDNCAHIPIQDGNRTLRDYVKELTK